MARNQYYILVLIGLSAGIISGLVGVGGGTIIIPSLILFLGYNQYQAQGLSIGVLVIPLSIISAFIVYYKNGHVNIEYSIWIAAGFLLGGYLGAKTAFKMSIKILQKIFYLFLLGVGIYFLLS